MKLYKNNKEKSQIYNEHQRDILKIFISIPDMLLDKDGLYICCLELTKVQK